MCTDQCYKDKVEQAGITARDQATQIIAPVDHNARALSRPGQAYINALRWPGNAIHESLRDSVST